MYWLLQIYDCLRHDGDVPVVFAQVEHYADLDERAATLCAAYTKRTGRIATDWQADRVDG